MVALTVSALALLVAVAAAGRAFVGSRHRSAAPASPYDDSALIERLGDIEQELAGIRATHDGIALWRDDLTIAVAEGVKQVKRYENRIKATVRRAREELAGDGIEHPGLDAEARDLFEGHEDGSRAPEMQPVPAGVDQNQRSAFLSLPGSWSEEDFRQMGI